MTSPQIELTESQLAELQQSTLFNADLAPVPPTRRKWRFGSFAALGIEDLVREMIIESKIIAHLHKSG